MNQLTDPDYLKLSNLSKQELKAYKYFLAPFKFLRAGSENREFAALSAYAGREEWDFSFSLDTVVSFLRAKAGLDLSLLEFLAEHRQISDELFSKL